MRRKEFLLFLSIFLFAGVTPACNCPEGTYVDTNDVTWHLRTNIGQVTGLVLASEACGGDYVVTGTTDGVNLSLRTENEYTETACCNPVAFSAVALDDCSEMEGYWIWPTDSNCTPGHSGYLHWTKTDLSALHGIDSSWMHF